MAGMEGFGGGGGGMPDADKPMAGSLNATDSKIDVDGGDGF